MSEDCKPRCEGDPGCGSIRLGCPGKPADAKEPCLWLCYHKIDLGKLCPGKKAESPDPDPTPVCRCCKTVDCLHHAGTPPIPLPQAPQWELCILWYEDIGNEYKYACRLRIREDAGEDCDGAILHEEDFEVVFSKFTDECKQIQYYAGPELTEWFGDFYLNLANFEDGCIPGSYEEDTCPVCCPCPESIDWAIQRDKYVDYGGGGWWWHTVIDYEVLDSTVIPDAAGNRIYYVDFTKEYTLDSPYFPCRNARGDTYISGFYRRAIGEAYDGVSPINTCDNYRDKYIQYNYIGVEYYNDNIYTPAPPTVPPPPLPIKRNLYNINNYLVPVIDPNSGSNNNTQLKCTQTYAQHGLGGIKDPGEPWSQVCGPQDTTECGPSFQNKVCFTPERYSAPYVTLEMPGCNMPMFPITVFATQDNSMPGMGNGPGINANGGGEQIVAADCVAPDANLCCPESAPPGFQLWPGCAGVLPRSAGDMQFVNGVWSGQPNLFVDFTPLLMPGYIELGSFFAYQGGFIENHPDNPNNYVSLYWRIKPSTSSFSFDPCSEFDVFGRCTVSFNYTVQQRAGRYDGTGTNTIIPGSNTYVDIGTFSCTVKWE